MAYNAQAFKKKKNFLTVLSESLFLQNPEKVRETCQTRDFLVQ
jgi:hypothetical protein